MLVVNRGAVNDIVVTLREKVTIVNPYYLLVIKGKSNQVLVKKVLTDVSTYPTKYNEFVFTEPTDIEIPYAGDFTYTFYQVATNTTTIPSDENILETGILRVPTAGITTVSHTTTRNTKIHEAQ